MDEAPFDIGPCLDQVRRGDEQAARDLVAFLNPLVVKIARAHLPARQTEDDLVQEIFSRVFQRLATYEARPGIPFEHWVSRLAVRVCLDLLRSERRRPEVRFTDLAEGEQEWLEFLADEDPTATSPDASAVDARAIVERLLSALKPEDRLVIALLDLEGRSAAEVAATTGWSSVGVRVRAFRARRRLRLLAGQLYRQSP